MARILFVHKSFPAQFGGIAEFMASRGHQCAFMAQAGTNAREPLRGVQPLSYSVQGGARATTHFSTRTLENVAWHASAIADSAEQHLSQCPPDLVVGHSGLGPTLHLLDRFPRAKFINYFEFFYHPSNSDIDFRPEWPPTAMELARLRTRNATFLLDLAYSDAGYTPTEYQKSRFPEGSREKLTVCHDGIDTGFWRKREDTSFVEQLRLPPDAKIITYVSRGLESIRGFDIFMQVAKRICTARRNVFAIVVGSEATCYGNDLSRIKERSYKEYVLNQDSYDLNRIRFVGRLPKDHLAQLLSRTSVHFYLTAPFVLSWSLLNAMATGALILGSDTAPVREVIQHDHNGLLRDFFDVEGLAAQALEVLSQPQDYSSLCNAAVHTVEQRYSSNVCLPRLADLLERSLG